MALRLERRRTWRATATGEARFQAELEERARLARQVQDTLLQGFTGLTLRMDAVRISLQEQENPLAGQLGEILEQADQTMRAARDMVSIGRPR
ncbi:MAG TPA: histidine kinase [Gemmatimonadales bacterium]|nr:histidine kinase [Gemmatimonadales bacterium]